MTRSTAIKLFKAITIVGVYAGLLVPLMFIPIVIFPFVFSKLIYFQIVVGLTFPAYLALAWMEPAYRPRKHALMIAIVSYFLAMMLSVIFAVDPLRAWWGNQERMNGLFTLLHFLAWMVMATGVAHRWEEWRKLLNYEVALSGIMALVAIAQRFKPDLLLFQAGPRVGGLVDNPIYMAAYQIFNLFFLALLFWKVKERTWRIFYVCVAGFDIVAFLLAQSRGALVGLAAGIIALAAYIGFVTKEKKVRVRVLGALALLFATYGALFLMRDVPVIAHSPLARLLDLRATVSTRLIAWEIAWNGFLERPLTGWGLDNFHILFNERYNPQSLRFGSYETWFDRAHNTVLDVLSMTGILGFLAFASIFGAILFTTLRAYRRGWIDLPIAAILFALPIAYFVQNLFVFDHPAGFSMSYLLFGLIIAATRGEFIGERPEYKEEGKRSAPWIAFTVVQVVMLLVVWRTSVLPFQASRLAIDSNNILGINPVIGYERAVSASQIWTPYLDEQAFLLSRNLVGITDVTKRVPNWQDLYNLAKQLSEEEIRRHPRNTHPKFVLARLAQSVMGVLPAEAAVAERYYLEAIETSPKRQQLHYGLARLYQQQGQVDKAIPIYLRVRDFDAELGEGYWNYGVVLVYDKRDYVTGAREIMQGLNAKYPYRLQDARELLPVFDAHLILEDLPGLTKVVDSLASYPTGSGQIYAALAWKLELTQQLELRDKVLAYGKGIDPNTESEYVKLVEAQVQKTQ